MYCAVFQALEAPLTFVFCVLVPAFCVFRLLPPSLPDSFRPFHRPYLWKPTFALLSAVRPPSLLTTVGGWGVFVFICDIYFKSY